MTELTTLFNGFNEVFSPERAAQQIADEITEMDRVQVPYTAETLIPRKELLDKLYKTGYMLNFADWVRSGRKKWTVKKQPTCNPFGNMAGSGSRL